MEDTMLELVEVCHQKEFHCMHDNIDDLIERALNSRLLSINSESQRLNKKKQEVKNVIEQVTECGTHPRIKSTKSAMDRSFTLGSTKKADNVKILQSCNGLLLCSGSGMPVFDYVYNPSTNQYKKLPYLDCSLDNSPYYSSVGLRIAFDPTKSSHYKLVDAGLTFCDIDIQIYSSETGKWSLCNNFGSREFTIYEMTIGCSVWMVRYRVHTDEFMTPLPKDLEPGSLETFFCSQVQSELQVSSELDFKEEKRRPVLIHEMEALGERGVAVDSLGSLKQTHIRETAKLAALTDAIAESLASIHEKERHVAKLDLND
nr:hypothetical protein [Tanacetum cinerariifolium]